MKEYKAKHLSEYIDEVTYRAGRTAGLTAVLRGKRTSGNSRGEGSLAGIRLAENHSKDSLKENKKNTASGPSIRNGGENRSFSEKHPSDKEIIAERGGLIIKIVLVALMVLFLVVVYKSNSAKDVAVSDIGKKMEKETDIDKYMKACGDRDLLQFMGLDYRNYDSYIYYKSGEALGVDELLIVKAKDPQDLTAVQDAVDKRVDSQIRKFDSYGPEQVKELDNSIIRKKGRYLFYCTAKSPEKYEEVFKNAI